MSQDLPKEVRCYLEKYGEGLSATTTKRAKWITSPTVFRPQGSDAGDS
jgi:hypothetical protein